MFIAPRSFEDLIVAEVGLAAHPKARHQVG